MKKSCMFSIILYVIVLHCLSINARDDSQSHVPAWPNNLIPNVQAYTQINRVEKDPFDLITPQNFGFTSSSSGQDWYQQHRQFVLSHVVGISLQGKTIKITPEDIGLINRICADNPHKSPDALRTQLSQSSAFNYAQHFLKADNLLHAFTPDIFIDPAHFKSVSESKHRIAKLEKAARDAIEERHKREKSQLESTYKEQLKVAKKKSKLEENRVASAHKKALTELDVRHKQEKKHPLGIKQPKKSVVGSLQSQSQATQQALSQQVTKKSNISSQEIQRLREHNNNQVSKRNREARSKVNSAQDRSFQQVMDNRSKAFEVSVKNQTPTTELIKINSQTAAFLQVHGIDIAQFQQIEGLPIQHQLTHELVDVLDAVADYAQQHHYEIYQTHLTKYCAHLASLSQQSNCKGALQQAIDGTNCCHGIEHYLTGMVSGMTQAYQQFQTALHYLQPTLEEYALIIEQHALLGIAAVSVLEAIVTAGLIAAPTTTVAATGIMIGATATVMAPLCLQAMIDTVAFGGACITGDWDKVSSDLDSFGKFMSSPETIARMAEFAGGTAMPTPNLSSVVDQVLSLRPVITSVQNASGEMVQSLYLMTKNQLQKVYTQGLELLQLPEFINFNMSYKKICGFNFFDILPQSHPALVGMAVSAEASGVGWKAGFLSSAEQAALTQLFTQAEGSIAGDIVKSGASSIGSQAVQVIEQGAKPLITEQARSIAQLHEVLQYEIAQVAKQPIVSIDLTAKIPDAKCVELRELSSQIRQLQDLAKYTDNFKNLENLIPEDIYYLNRVYELQSYRVQIKKFLDTYKPYFIYDGQQYFIEDIALYHIHAGDYARKEKPKGGHSNYGGNKLDCFKPEIIKSGPIGAKDVLFYNSRNINLTKPSSIYPESWSEFVCDLKAIEVMMSDNVKILKSSNAGSGTLKMTGTTKEGLDVIIYYDIAHKRIKSHYPDSENF